MNPKSTYSGEHFLSLRKVARELWPRLITEALYLAIFLTPFVLHLSVNILTIKAGLFVDGDWATLSIMTGRAQAFEQLLGNYSRFGWSHLGPALFYMIGGLSLLFKDFATPEMLAVFCYQMIFLYLSYRMLIAYIGFPFALTVVAMMWFLIIASRRIFPGEFIHMMFLNYWAPVMTVMPMLLLLISAAMVATGSRPALLPLAFATALLPQLHIGTSFHAVVFFLLPVGFYLRRYSKEAGLHPFAVCKDHLIWIISVMGIFALIWCLPLYEALINGGGNLFRVIRFFILGAPDSSGTVSILDALKYLGIYYVLPMRGLLSFFGIGQGAFSLALWCVFIAVNALILVYGLIQMGSQCRIMVFMVFLFFVLSIFSIRNIRGELYQFILYWQYANVAIVYAIVVSGLCHGGAVMTNKFRLSGRWKYGRHVAAVAIFMSVCIALSQMARVSFASQEANREFYRTIKDWIGKDESEVVLIAGDHDTWPHIAGVLNAGYGDGLELCVPEEWLFLYGQPSKCSSISGAKELIFFQHRDQTQIIPYLLGKTGDVVKFEHSDYGTRYIARVGFRSPLGEKTLALNMSTKIDLLNTFEYKRMTPKRIETSCNLENVRFMNDGNPGTRWDTGRASENGDFVTVSFHTPVALAAIKLEYSNSPMDIPDEIALYYGGELGNWKPLGFSMVKSHGKSVLLLGQERQVRLKNIKIEVREGSPSYYWSIHELSLFIQQEVAVSHEG